MRHLVVVAAALLVGCSAGDFGGEQPLFTVSVQSPVGGTFTAMQRNAFGAGGGSNAIFRGTGAFQEVLRSVSYRMVDTSWQEIRGTYTGVSLVVGFGTRTVGGSADAGVGAQSGSLQNVDGPQQQTLPCQVQYGPSAAAGSTYSVRFRYTANRANMCSAP